MFVVGGKLGRFSPRQKARQHVIPTHCDRCIRLCALLPSVELAGTNGRLDSTPYRRLEFGIHAGACSRSDGRYLRGGYDERDGIRKPSCLCANLRSRYSPNGTLLWDHVFGAYAGSWTLPPIAIGADGAGDGFVASNNSIFKYSPAGNLVLTYTSGGYYYEAVAGDSSGNAYVAGQGLGGAFAAKLTPAGSVASITALSGPSPGKPRSRLTQRAMP